MHRWLAVLAFPILAIASEQTVATRALSPDRSVANPAIAELRAKGQAGVDALVAAGAGATDPSDITRYRAALDRVCRQRDCASSHLFWYTDLDAAQAAARAEGKPILSLRLLGNLDDELSCANSRFFRTTLYSNPTIAGAMRDAFVLHWSSERPVPKVTVDFGDGRKLCRTVTGNSIHYLLDADGNVLDAIPGLYSPDAFLGQLESLKVIAASYGRVEPAKRAEFVRRYHTNIFRTVISRRNRELRLAALALPPDEAAKAVLPTAAIATLNTQSKAMVESRFLADIGQPLGDVAPSVWKKMAERHAAEVHFHPNSLALMQEKAAQPSPEMMERMQRTVAEDTARNEYDFHLRIHQWLAGATGTSSFDGFNTRVYAELFLTPKSDPWLGLLADESFSAVDGGGVVTGSK
jgi:hypothetical protein